MEEVDDAAEFDEWTNDTTLHRDIPDADRVPPLTQGSQGRFQHWGLGQDKEYVPGLEGKTLQGGNVFSSVQV